MTDTDSADGTTQDERKRQLDEIRRMLAEIKMAHDISDEEAELAMLDIGLDAEQERLDKLARDDPISLCRSASITPGSTGDSTMPGVPQTHCGPTHTGVPMQSKARGSPDSALRGFLCLLNSGIPPLRDNGFGSGLAAEDEWPNPLRCKE
jgi:hypothetical protein